MSRWNLVYALPVVALLGKTGTSCAADAKFPDWEGNWYNPKATKAGVPWDEGEPAGLGQNAPLTDESRAILEASLKAQAQGGRGNNQRAICLLDGMPRMMSLESPMEVIINGPKQTTFVFQSGRPRRIYTDGRDWPNMAPSFQGISLGKWIDENKDGTYDVLEVETRNFKGPRAFEASGIPLAEDGETVVKERIFLDKQNKDILVNEITTTDSALTKPWTVTKKYARDRERKIRWEEYNCQKSTNVVIGDEEYLVDAKGNLAPSRPGQPPPDLTYFKQAPQPAAAPK
jgi:hypothetical protein